MNVEQIRQLFEEVRAGKVTPDDAVQRMHHLPFEDLGFAKVDHHRLLRNGMPEVIFGQGKTAEQVSGIFGRLAERGTNVLVTRATPEHWETLRNNFPGATYQEQARAIVLTARQ